METTLTIDDIDLPTHARDILRCANLTELFDIAQCSREELRTIRNMADADVDDIQQALMGAGYTLAATNTGYLQKYCTSLPDVIDPDQACFADRFPSEVARELKKAGLYTKSDFERVTMSELSRVPGVNMYVITKIVTALQDTNLHYAEKESHL